MNQREHLALYNEKNREPFNLILFERNENDIIEDLKKILISSQREKFFTIRIKAFRVIEDYIEIKDILHGVEAESKNKRIKYNIYDMIDLKDSAIKLLEVDYFLSTGDESKDLKVYIAVPRIVDKYYFRIGGCLYSPLYQIVDGSTYNNSGNSKRDKSVTMKTLLSKNTTYLKYFKVQLYTKEYTKCGCFVTDLFKNRIPTIKYFLAKFGFYGALFSFLRLENIYVTDTPNEDPNYYCFMRYNLFVSIPKYYFDNNMVAQSAVYTIYQCITKDTALNQVFTDNFWKECLGADLKTRTVTKGESVLDSFEHIYDINTHDILRLPEDQKCDIYCLTRWIIYEFEANLRKENTDITTKRIRFSEYIASMYANKLSTNIYSKISNFNSKVSMKNLVQAVNIRYNYLIEQLKKCKINPYKNSVNDNDALNVLKFTYKGISGIGENKSSAVQKKYRFVNASHIGKVDLNSSSNGDPGMSGTLCPYVQLYDGSFSDFKEPNSWQETIDSMMDTYRKMNGKKELFEAKQSILGIDQTTNIESVNADIEQVNNIVGPCISNSLITEQKAGYPLEESGLIWYGYEENDFMEGEYYG